MELPRRPEILVLHVVRLIGRQKQLHLKVTVCIGGRQLVLDLLVNMGAQVSLITTGLLPRESLPLSQRPMRLKVADEQRMSGG